MRLAKGYEPRAAEAKWYAVWEEGGYFRPESACDPGAVPFAMVILVLVIWDRRLMPSSVHGVTTIVIGNCGVGFAPCRPADRDALVELMAGVEDIPEVVMADDWQHGYSREVAAFPVASLRRGILHNAEQRSDGSWVWRYRRFFEPDRRGSFPRFAEMWDAISAMQAPLMLIRGMRSAVVDDEDEAELLRRRPTARVAHVPEAGHSVQGDAPVALARLIEGFVFR